MGADGESLDSQLVIDAFIVAAGSTKKAASLSGVDELAVTVRRLISDKKYGELVDFDDHLNIDTRLDWTNPSFN